MFIFVCPKMNQKGQPFTWFDCVELSCAAQNNRALRNSHPPAGCIYHLAGCSDSPRAIPVIFLLLGCVKWQKFSMLVLGTHSAPLSIAAGCHFLASSFAH